MAALLLATACARPPQPARPTSEEWSRPLAASLARAVDRGYPGVVAAVSLSGGESWSGAAGLADVANGEPMTVEHAVHLASVTKQITAAATLRLVERGRLDLDDRLTDLLPWPEVESLPHSGRIVLRQLLDHTSGLYPTNNDPEYIEAWLGAEAFDFVHWTPRRFLEIAARREPPGEPGEAARYSDTNYLLLAAIVETVTGEPLPDHVRRTLFEPLGMGSAYYLSGVPLGAETPRLAARGYLSWSEELGQLIDRSRFTEVAPGLLDTTIAGERLDGAAGVVATAPDLLRFADAYLRGALLAPEHRGWILSLAERAAAEPVGTSLQEVATAHHRPWGTVITAEGDGPGGSNTMIGFHPDTGTLAVGLINGFGFGGESDYLVDDLLATAVALER